MPDLDERRAPRERLLIAANDGRHYKLGDDEDKGAFFKLSSLRSFQA